MREIVRRAYKTMTLAGGLAAALSSCGGGEAPRQTVDIKSSQRLDPIWSLPGCTIPNCQWK